MANRRTYRVPKSAGDTYETELNLTATVYGQEVTVEDVPCTVTYEFEPGERAIKYGDNACPGADPEVTIGSVTVDATGEDVTDQADKDSLAETIAEWIGTEEVNAKADDDDRRYEEAKDRRLMGRDY